MEANDSLSAVPSADCNYNRSLKLQPWHQQTFRALPFHSKEACEVG